jgi:hypothetical protein
MSCYRQSFSLGFALRNWAVKWPHICGGAGFKVDLSATEQNVKRKCQAAVPYDTHDTKFELVSKSASHLASHTFESRTWNKPGTLFFLVFCRSVNHRISNLGWGCKMQL